MNRFLMFSSSATLYIYALFITSIHIIILAPFFCNIPKISIDLILNPIYHIIRNIALTKYGTGIILYLTVRYVDIYWYDYNSYIVFTVFYISCLLSLRNFKIALLFALVKFYEQTAKPNIFSVSNRGLIPNLMINFTILYRETIYGYKYCVMFLILSKLLLKFNIIMMYEFIFYYFWVFFFENVFVFYFSLLFDSLRPNYEEDESIVDKHKIHIFTENSFEYYIDETIENLQEAYKNKYEWSFFNPSYDHIKLDLIDYIRETLYKKYLLFMSIKKVNEVVKMIKIKFLFKNYNGCSSEASRIILKFEKFVGEELFDNRMIDIKPSDLEKFSFFNTHLSG